MNVDPKVRLTALFASLDEPLVCGHPLRCLPEHDPGQVVKCGWCAEVGALRQQVCELEHLVWAERQQNAVTLQRAEARERPMQSRERSEWADEQDALRRSRGTP